MSWRRFAKAYVAARCNYCDQPPEYFYYYSSPCSRMGQRQYIRVKVQACKDHKHSLDIIANLHPGGKFAAGKPVLP